MARHDAKRTGAAAGKSNIEKPEVAWSTYLGGALRPTELLSADVEGHGTNALIRSAQGSLAAVRADGSIVWKAATGGATSLLGVADLAGNGNKEVIAYSDLRTMAFDLHTGALAWAQPAGEMGRISVVRLADMNGDGLPDLVVTECQGCGGNKPQTGFIYSFAGGFAAPHRVMLPYPETRSGFTMTPANMDGIGGDELVTDAAGAVLALVDGTTGAMLAQTPDLGFDPTTYYVTGCVPQATSAAPAETVICVLAARNAPAPGPGEPSRVFALTWASGSPALAVRWSYSLAPNLAIAATGQDLAADLDGDGSFETLVTAYDASGVPSVRIVNAATGVELGSIPGQILAGTAAALPGGKRVIMTTQAQGPGISFWSFSAMGVTALGKVADNGVATSVDRARMAVSTTGYLRPIALDVNGDGATDVLTGDSTTGTLNAYTPGATPPALVATLTAPADDPLSGIWPVLPTDRPYPQIAVVETDGTLRLLDRSFSFTSTSIKVGGFYADGHYGSLGVPPVVAALEQGAPAQVLITGTRGLLVRLDASKATPTVPPQRVWQMADGHAPIIVPGADGSSAGIFAFHVNRLASPPPYALRRLRADGTVVWETPLPDGPLSDFLPGRFDADGIPDLAVQTGSAAMPNGTVSAISGADGHRLWSTSVPGCYQESGVALADWNGDGFDDVVQQSAGTYVLSGLDGSQLEKGGPADCYYLPVLADTSGTGADSVIYTASFADVQEYAHDLTTDIFTNTEVGQPFPYGAIATCPGGKVLVEGSWAFPSRLKLTALAGSASTPAGAATAVFLVGGAAYPDQASANAAGIAQLTAANVHQNLTGSGRPAAVVGASDGWLYAVDPCTGTLDFAYSFAAPVGEPVFGDTDGDGLDEIVVSVADGYLYALHNASPSAGTGGGGAWIPLYGRAGCYCSTGAASASAPEALASLALAAGLVAARARRSRWRRPGRRARCDGAS